MKKALLLRIPFYLGLSLLFVSALFRIQHWPGHTRMFWIGFACQVLFFILLFAEMLLSKKATNGTKAFWLIAYAAVLSTCFFMFPEYGVMVFAGLGFVYLILGRRYFLFTKEETEPVQFDSI